MKEDKCKHHWAPLLAQVGKKTVSTLAGVCLKCGELKIGKRTVRISRFGLNMGGHPIVNCSRGTGAGLRVLYAGDETARNVSGTTETEIKFHRMILNTDMGRNYTRLFFVGEAHVTGGTGSLRVSLNGAASVAVWTFTNTAWAHQEGFIDIAWANKTVNTISVRLVNSGAFVTHNRTLEVYVE